MNAERLRSLRLARGLTLDELAAAMGGVVSKQALSKYERGLNQPTPRVLVRLGEALGVKAIELEAPPPYEINFIGYRKRSSLPKKTQERIENYVKRELEVRLRLQELVNPAHGVALPVDALPAESIEALEEAAGVIRDRWNLGRDPIANLMDALEDHAVHVIEVDAPATFDGLSALADSEGTGVQAAALAVRRGLPGERQRLDLAHELGHVVLHVEGEQDLERAAYGFAGALLAPAEALFEDVGRRRSRVSYDELAILKKQWGVSLQALLVRLHLLGVINDSHYQQWWKRINAQGWRRCEPLEMEPEQPRWLEQHVLRAFAEGLITAEEASELLGRSLASEFEVEPSEREAFMELSDQQRRRVLEGQAQGAVGLYEPDDERTAWQSGEFLDE